MRLLPIFCILSTIAFSSLATTKNQQFHGSSLGISHDFSQQDLSVYIDQNKILKNIPRLQKAGLVDKNLTSTEAGFYETQLSAMVSIAYVIKIIKGIYSSNSEDDPIHIKSYLNATDLYGNKTKILCYSFNFNRELYQKINWYNFQANNIIKIAPNFKTSKVCKMLKETSL